MSDGQSSVNGQMQVDTDKLQQGSTKLAELAARLVAAGRHFDEDCDAQGQPWGDDKGGKKFYGQYQQPHQDAKDAGVSSGQGLAETATRLSDLASALDLIEQQAAASGWQLTQPSGGA